MTNPKQDIAVDFEFAVPESLGSGSIVEQDYRVTAGTNYLLSELVGESFDISEVEHTSLVRLLTDSDEDNVTMSIIMSDDLGPEILRELYTTAALTRDRYDIAEALRLSDPVYDLLEAQMKLNKTLDKTEEEFLVKRYNLSSLLSVVDRELSRPYRVKEIKEVDTAPAFVPGGSYVIEDDVVSAVDSSKHTETRSILRERASRTSRRDTQDQLLEMGDWPGKSAMSFLRVQAFIDGETNSVDFYDVSMVHTIISAEEISRIRASSDVGKLSLVAAGASTREFAWSGRQIELDLPWHSVVSGGNASQN